MAEGKLPCATCGHKRELHGGRSRDGACRHGSETNRCACSRFRVTLAPWKAAASELAPPEVEEPCDKCGHARKQHVGHSHTGTCVEDGCECRRYRKTRKTASDPRTVRTIALSQSMHDALMRALLCASTRHQPEDDLDADELRKLTYVCRSAKITEVVGAPERSFWKSPAAQGSRYYRATTHGPQLYIEPWSLAQDRARQGESSWYGTRIPPGWTRVHIAMPMGDPQRGEDPSKPSRAAAIETSRWEHAGGLADDAPGDFDEDSNP